MLTNELKRGTAILLSDGRSATLMDSRKGNIRNAVVKTARGDVFGSIYAWNITNAVVDGHVLNVELTEGQRKARTAAIAAICG